MIYILQSVPYFLGSDILHGVPNNQESLASGCNISWFERGSKFPEVPYEKCYGGTIFSRVAASHLTNIERAWNEDLYMLKKWHFWGPNLVAFLQDLEQSSNQNPVLSHWTTNLVHGNGWNFLLCTGVSIFNGWILKYLYTASQKYFRKIMKCDNKLCILDRGRSF